jgi:hypothetical protein
MLVGRRERVRVLDFTGEFERCHEGGVLGHARGEPRIRAELIHPVTGNRHLEGVVSLLADAPERKAR